MKKIILPLIVIPILFNACTKGGGGGTNNGGGGNNGGGNGSGNGGGGGTGGITITSVTPANPYPDEEITITGTGFNIDPTKDTVEFGRLISGNFGAWHDGLESEWASLCTVVSATATQLKIKAVNTFVLDFDAFPTANNTSIAVVQVRTGGKKAVSPVIPFKRLVLLSGISNPDLFNDAIGRPNDSLVINGKGFRSSGVHVSIGGTEVTNLKIDSTPYASTITCRLPKTFFGTENDETIMQDKVMTITQPDGKAVTKTLKFLISPQMRIISMQAGSPTYSLGSLNSSGGQVNITVSGKCLKSDAIVKLDGVGIHTQSGLQVSGFVDNVVLNLSPGSLIAGNLQVSIWRGNTAYGACSFTVSQ